MSNRKPQTKDTDRKRTPEARQTTLDRKAARAAKRGARSC